MIPTAFGIIAEEQFNGHLPGEEMMIPLLHAGSVVFLILTIWILIVIFSISMEKWYDRVAAVT